VVVDYFMFDAKRMLYAVWSVLPSFVAMCFI